MAVWPLLLAACAGVPSVRCGPGETAAASEMLYFGTGRADAAPVSPDEWQAFLREAVAPRFPAGLTVWTASGQWRGADGATVHEDSHVLQLLHEPSAQADAAVREIVADYRARFRQEAVLRVRSAACMSL